MRQLAELLAAPMGPVFEYLLNQWSALIWTALGLASMRWCLKLLRRWVPGYRTYRRSKAADDADYAWSRMLKSAILFSIDMVCIGIGTVLLLGPTGQGEAPSFRGYVVIVGLLIIRTGLTSLAYLMNREDEQQIRLGERGWDGTERREVTDP